MHGLKNLRQVQRKLINAILENDASLVKKILDEREAANEKLEFDEDFIADSSISKPQTYLQCAVQACNMEMIAIFLDAGASIDATNRVWETSLHLACDYSVHDSLRDLREKVVKYLLKRGADINRPTDTGCTPLMIACTTNNVPLVKLFLGAKANTDFTDYNGNSALHLSLLACDSTASVGDVVDMLARHACQVNQSNKQKMTPAMLAAQKGYTNVLQTLLLAGCDLECVDGENCTALSLAAQYKHTNSVRLLLQNGADPTRANYRWLTPLLFAVMKLDVPTIDVILSSPLGLSTIDTPNCEGVNPILYAVREASQSHNALQTIAGHIVCTLLKHGCDINSEHGSTGDTPLIISSKAANIDLVSFMLNNGAMVNLADGCGETALNASIDSSQPSSKGNHLLTLVRLLVNAGCDVNICNQSGLTALHKAAYKGCSVQIVKYLIDVGTQLNTVSRDANRYSPLQSAISSQSKDTAMLLIDRGCDINHQSAAGETALTLAIRQDSNDIVKRLLSMPSCDVDAGGRNPPLHVATDMGKELVVAELVKRGADVNKRDSRGDTAVQIAIERHHGRIIRLLMTTGCSFVYHGLSAISPLNLLQGSVTPPDRQPLFLAVQHDDLELFKGVLSRYHRKPFHLLKTLHDMLTIDNQPSQRQPHMMSTAGRQQLLTLLREELCTTDTLLQMCRGEIRKVLGGQRIDKKVLSLPISLSLKHYLLFDTDRHLDLSDIDVS